MSLQKIAPKPATHNNSDEVSNEDPSQNSSTSGTAKRAHYACTACKKAKTKCNGPPAPCQRCIKFGGECIFDQATDQRRKIAFKRAADDLRYYQDLLSQLLSTIGQSDQLELLQLQSLVRSGPPLDTINDFISEKSRLLDARGLGASRASTELKDAKTKLDRLQESTNGTEPFAKRQMLTDSEESQEAPSDVLEDGSKEVSPVSSSMSARRQSEVMSLSNLCDMVPIRVPVHPWTGAADHDQDAVSHLISLFFTWINPFWHMVEQDVFLDSMRVPHESPDSFCSPFLVNAILSISSHFSNHPLVFVEKKDPMSRGLQFHQEARNCWTKEEGRASLVNLQALYVLSIDSNIRGKDKLGWTMLNIMQGMHRDLGLSRDPPPTRLKNHRDSERILRVRRSISWAVFNVSSLLSLIMLRTNVLEVPRIARPYNSTELYQKGSWQNYPRTDPPKEVEANLAFDALCDLMIICRDVSNLLFSDHGPSEVNELRHVAEDILRRLNQWEANLPPAIRYRQYAVPSISDLVITRYYMEATLFSFLRTPEITPVKNASNAEFLIEIQWRAIKSVHEFANIIRHYRQEYTLERITIVMLSVSYMGCCILLEDMDNPHSVGDFVDLFQCLFAGSHRFFLARALAQMVLLTAKRLSRPLPQQVTAMVRAGLSVDSSSPGSLRETERKATTVSWQPEDSLVLNSFYPNYTLAKQNSEEDDDVGMENFIKKWNGMGLRHDPDEIPSATERLR